MKKAIALICFAFSIAVFAGDLENTINRCCNEGKTWSSEKKSCNITLTFPLFNVPIEHSTMCLTTVGACCLHSLRKLRCNEGKQVGLENGMCNGKNQPGKNLVDFTMCCEICKIGVAVGLTENMCEASPLFDNDHWSDVYQSCCNTAKVKWTSTETRKIYDTAGVNRCVDGTHNCTYNEKCVITPNGFECQSRALPSALSMPPDGLGQYKKKPNCRTGYTFDVREQRCKDINECTQQPCDINEVCENTIGSHRCICKKGFQLDNITNACTDINECQLNLHTCQLSQRCDNTVGSYQCIRLTGCGTGYTLDVESSLCKDDDECALKTDTCSVLGPEWVCRNTLGSFRCEKKRCTGPSCGAHQNAQANRNAAAAKCPRGFKVDGNNKCIDVDECRWSDRCLKNEVCRNTNGSYYCLPKSNNFPRR